MSLSARNFLCCLALASLALPATALAAHRPTPVLPNEQSYYEGLPVVLSASRLYQPVNEAPAAVTVIDHDMIEAIGPRDLAELFRLVPGMAVAYDSVHNPVVAYHGIADQYARRMQVLVDGRSVYLPSWGGVPWNDLPLVVDDIDRIEVIRGPNAVAYGSNSYLGVISIITRHPSQDPGTTLRFVAGNNDIADGVARFAGGDGSQFFRLTAMYQRDDGLNADPRRLDGGATVNPDRRKVRKLTGRVDLDSSAENALMLQFGLDSGDMVQGFGGDENDPPHDVEASSGFVQLRWEHDHDPEHSLALQFFYDRHTWDEGYFTEPLDLADSIAGLARGQIFVQPFLDKSFWSERYELEVESRDRWSRELRSVVGGSLRRDRVDMGDFTTGLGANDYDLQRLFGNLEWAPLRQLRLNAGVMMERNEFTGSNWLPRLALNWLVNPRHTLRASISKATRTPVVVEERSNWVVHLNAPFAKADLLLLADDFDLRGETIISRELGYHVDLVERGLSFDLRYFDDQLDELIGAQAALGGPPAPLRVNSTRALKNLSSLRKRGVEAQLDWELGRRTRAQITYSNIQARVSDRTPGDLERSVPRETASLFLSHRFQHDWRGTVTLSWVSPMAWLDEGALVDSVTQVDLRVAKNFRLPGGTHARAAVTWQNLDGRNQSFREENVFDDRIWGEVRVEW